MINPFKHAFFQSLGEAVLDLGRTPSWLGGRTLPVDLIRLLSHAPRIGAMFPTEAGPSVTITRLLVGRNSFVVSLDTGEMFECAVRKLGAPEETARAVSPVEDC